MTERILIIGAGQIGRAAALRFVDDGWQVTVARKTSGRPPGELVARGVRVIDLDRDDTEAFFAAVRPGFEAAIDTVAFDGKHARQWVAARSQVGRLAVISTGSVYADAQGRTLDEASETGFPEFPIPIGEDQPRTAPGPSTYSTRKVGMEDELLGSFDRGLTVLRPFAVYGPGSRSPREWWFLARILAGVKTIPLADEGRPCFQTSASANIAELCHVGLSQAGVHVLNAADPEALTVAEIGRVILDALGSPAELAPYAGPPKATADYTPWSVKRPLIADMSAAEALGYRPKTDYRRFAGETCRALLQAAEAVGWRAAFPGLAAYPAAMFESQAPQT